MTAMNITLLGIVLATAAVWSPAGAQAPTPSVRTGQMRSEELHVETVSRPVAARAVEVKADVRLPSGSTESGYIVAVFEPTSGLFWWRFEVGNPMDTAGPLRRLKDQWIFSLVDSKLVAFGMTGRFLSVRESSDHVGALEDGLAQATTSLNASVDEIDRGTKKWFTQVDLGNLGFDFFLARGSAATQHPPKVVAVSFSAGKWDVTLLGPNQDKVVVTLDRLYTLLGTRPAR